MFVNLRFGCFRHPFRPVSDTTGFRRLHLRRCNAVANYRILTPPKQKTEFRKQETEATQNRGVETRQLVSPGRGQKSRRQKPVVGAWLAKTNCCLLQNSGNLACNRGQAGRCWNTCKTRRPRNKELAATNEKHIYIACGSCCTIRRGVRSGAHGTHPSHH